MVEKQSTQQHFGFFFPKKRAASKCQTSYIHAILHETLTRVLSHFVCKLFTILMLNRTCKTGPLLTGIYDLHGTASFQSKVSQSTVMSCLTDSSYVRAKRKLDNNLNSCFEPLQLQGKGPSNTEQAEPSTGMSLGLRSHPDR